MEVRNLACLGGGFLDGLGIFSRFAVDHGVGNDLDPVLGAALELTDRNLWLGDVLCLDVVLGAVPVADIDRVSVGVVGSVPGKVNAVGLIAGFFDCVDHTARLNGKRGIFVERGGRHFCDVGGLSRGRRGGVVRDDEDAYRDSGNQNHGAKDHRKGNS